MDLFENLFILFGESFFIKTSDADCAHFIRGILKPTSVSTFVIKYPQAILPFFGVFVIPLKPHFVQNQ